MADEIGRVLAVPDQQAQAFALLERPGTRLIGWAAGGAFRAVHDLVPLALDHLIDSDPAKWKTRVKGIEVRPVENLREEDPGRTLVILYSANQRPLRERLATFGVSHFLSASDLLEAPDLPRHCIANPTAWFEASPEQRARRAIERTFLWPVLRMPRRARFAIEGEGEISACVLSLCRKHGREPVVILDALARAGSLDGVPLREPAKGVDEFRPERILDCRVQRSHRVEVDVLQTNDAWRQWQSLRRALDVTRYEKREAGHHWAHGHVALWEQLAASPACGEANDDLASFRGPNLEPADLSSAIEGFRDKQSESREFSLGEVTGKQIALVGPAGSLVGARRGEEIDAHDVVVRLNTTVEHLPFDAADASDFGRRCDSLYVSYAYLDKLFEHRSDAIDRAVDEAGLREVVCVDSLLKVDAFAGDHRGRVDAIREELARRHPRVRFHFESDLVRMLLFWLAGHAPRMGFAAIVDILSRRPAALSVLGFTFYHGGGHLFRALQPKELDPRTSNSGKASLHDSRLELRMLGRLRAGSEIPIELDPTLEALLDNPPEQAST